MQNSNAEEQFNFSETFSQYRTEGNLLLMTFVLLTPPETFIFIELVAYTFSLISTVAGLIVAVPFLLGDKK